MNSGKVNLAIIFHSGSFDRIYNGLSIALTELSLGRNAKLLFTYWSLEYLRRDNSSILNLDREAEKYKSIIEKNIENGHFEPISELFVLTKKLGGKIYVCVSSMALMDLKRDEMIDEVDESIGVPKFLMDTKEDRLLFI